MIKVANKREKTLFFVKGRDKQCQREGIWRRKRAAAWLCAVGLLLGALPGCGSEAGESPAPTEDLPTIMVGSDNYPPYNYEDVNGQPTGIDVDLAKEAFRRMGYQAVFTTIDWEAKKELVESGEIDCIWGSFSIDGREDQYHWSEPYMYSRQVVAVRPDSDIYELADLAGKRVAVQSTTKPEELFLAQTDARIPKVEEVFSLQNRELVYPYLSKGYADAIAAHETAILQCMSDYAHQLQVTNEQLSVAVDQADRANAAKTSFLSRMSYDIRTPLNGIIGLLEIDAAHPEDTELVNANRDKMRVAADHLLSLINDILQMSKLESGEITLAHEPINLNQLSRDILTIIGQKAAESGITMEYDTTSDPVAVPWVYGSPLHLRQIFLNIYTNCIKYNKVGGKVCSKVVCLGMAENTVTYRWIITDTGIGMSQEFLERIFDPFSQERTDARSVYHGTGLGMAIVKGLVEQMNGTIEISSEEGVGSTFVITLPFEVMENTGPVLQPKEGNEATIHGLRLLLAEDNELNAEIAQMLLEDEGAIVTIVADGRQAVEEFQNNPPGTFDAILMDVMMPVMDGLTATREIRALPRPDAKTIPIIAMTANAFAEDAQKCLEAGMTAHLAKPLEMKKAVAIMARCCRPKE